MNCPSRPDEIEGHPDWNQSPHALSADLTTRADLNGIVNLREQRQNKSSLDNSEQEQIDSLPLNAPEPPPIIRKRTASVKVEPRNQQQTDISAIQQPPFPLQRRTNWRSPSSLLNKAVVTLQKYAKFVGPGFLIAVAYIDPGNYATDVQAGAAMRYRHLFVILLSNLFAIFLQSLCIKLGSVTGLNLAENCRKHLPKWLTITLYLFAEAAIIATDMAEVIGSAIALNLLLHIPLVAGCAITLIDVLLLLLFYKPDGSMTRLRVFEFFVMGLVLGVMVCFCIQLSYIRDTSAAEVFQGYLPSAAVVQGNGIYLSCGIMGATVMPHSIFLGSGVVQPRLKQFDEQNGHIMVGDESDDDAEKYRPSVNAIRSCLKYSVAELAFSLFTFALFVNSAILIVAGSSLYPETSATDADLFGIHDLLSKNLSKGAGTIFALALLLSGTSAGIVCTMAGQMVSEGMLHWTIKPWMRRLITRSISITPSIIIAAAVGKEGLNQALTASQVALSVILPFVTAPLVWFTCRSHIMSVPDDAGVRGGEAVNMRNGWVIATLSVLIWLVLVVMNIALLVLVGLGKA
ncbi:NRAMP-like transporter smf-3 [Elasticomyces elasticus]|uniref:NRAMP-like transporter smf-3 n=1 Tax=Exophiala sideris TaxID=1016849 RepID=A0ABR0JR87_9EURO|nr:NRAMP-like transporter smf-3 [Elasticomyces elasticus]KAK5034648.1 NRAMP-like transporter smf-3 [Exophiala sideris]KAK5040030.1 NRAMP-like transporter smf-3 [Exophiala sideris]KAK5068408.1 NRAMP-like transporter smf-3 [Exophiala sideris]KAK5187710.1 NRAMP-like transporter smf-3 [Eurotiomycetes sp. CCFEE 6388]